MRFNRNCYDVLDTLYGSLAELNGLGLLYDVMPVHTVGSPP